MHHAPSIKFPTMDHGERYNAAASDERSYFPRGFLIHTTSAIAVITTMTAK